MSPNSSEWYPREMYRSGDKRGVFQHHVAKYGPQSKFGYKDFIPMFRAEKYSPQDWAQLFKNSGAKFVMPVAEHHDGFQMYASDLSNWNAAKMGPKRDLVGDLAKEVRKQGLHFAASSHRAEHWFFILNPAVATVRIRHLRVAATGCSKNGCHPEDDLRSSWNLVAANAELGAAGAELPFLGSWRAA